MRKSALAPPISNFMGIEEIQSQKETIDSMGLVPGELDANDQEIDPERVALFKKMVELRREIESDYIKAMGAAALDNEEVVVTEAAKETTKALFDKLKHRD